MYQRYSVIVELKQSRFLANKDHPHQAGGLSRKELSLLTSLYQYSIVELCRLCVEIVVYTYLQGEGITVVESTSCPTNLIAILPQVGQRTSISWTGKTFLYSHNSPS